MSPSRLEVGDFPAAEQSVLCSWAPISIEPLLGSGERLTIGVVAANMHSWFLARANGLDRLRCILEEAAGASIFAAETSLDMFEMELAEHGLSAMKEPRWLFESIALGQIHEVRGKSVRDVATLWLSHTSSLHVEPAPRRHSVFALLDSQSGSVEEHQPIRDRLPRLVFEYVVAQRPGLSRAFAVGASERPRRRSHEISIDFFGSGIVANLGTLVAGGIGSSVERIKRKMWDLKVERDRHRSPLLGLSHEMLVQHPANDDPQLTPRQWDNLSYALADLERQADTEDIRFRPLTTVKAIGEHILKAEAA